MTKLTLTYVSRTERATKADPNKKFISLSIKAQEYGDRFLSGFGNKDNAGWKEGDCVEVAEVKEVEKDGKKYLNFEMSRRLNIEDVMKALEEVRGQNAKILLGLREIYKFVAPPTQPLAPSKVDGTDMDYPEPETDDIPFDH